MKRLVTGDYGMCFTLGTSLRKHTRKESIFPLLDTKNYREGERAQINVMHPLQDKATTRHTFLQTSQVLCCCGHTVATTTVVTGQSDETNRCGRAGLASWDFFLFFFPGTHQEALRSRREPIRGGEEVEGAGLETVGVFKALDWTLDCGRRLWVR